MKDRILYRKFFIGLLTSVLLSFALGAYSTRASIPSFQHVLIDPKMVPNGHKPKVIGDFSGTGVEDVAVMTLGQGMAIYRYPDWTKYVISPEGQGGEDAQVADINKDGALDIVIGGLFNETLWLENPRDSGLDPYTHPWKVHIINQGINSHGVVVGDVDKNGRTDVAVTGALFLQNNPDSWTDVGPQQIKRGAEGTALADILGDGYLDLIAPSPDKPYRLMWFENPAHTGGNPARDEWKPHVIGPGYDQMTIATADIDHHGRLDILMAPMYQTGGLVWFAAPWDRRNGTWVRHVINHTIQYVHQGSLVVADFAGDGRTDIAFAEQEQSPTKRIGIFYPMSRDGLSWKLQILATTGGHNIKVGRIGKDRLPSILSANHGFFGAPNPVELWRNLASIRHGSLPDNPATNQAKRNGTNKSDE